MQCPPIPGPGWKGMKPKGLVAAASMTSRVLTPRYRHMRENSLARAEAVSGFLGGGDHVGDVRVFGLAQWRGDADEDRVALREDGGLRGRVVASGSEERLELRARHVGDVRATTPEGRNAVGVGVEPRDVEARSGEFDGQRESHVPLADDADPGAVSCYLTDQRRGVMGGRPRVDRHIAMPPGHSTVTLLARFLGWSTSQPRRTPR